MIKRRQHIDKTLEVHDPEISQEAMLIEMAFPEPVAKA
jgi:hypothetical protein